jgi:hypothetical protein
LGTDQISEIDAIRTAWEYRARECVRTEGGHMRVDPETVLTLLAVVDEAVALTEALVRVHNEDPYGYGAVTVQRVWTYADIDDDVARGGSR